MIRITVICFWGCNTEIIVSLYYSLTLILLIFELCDKKTGNLTNYGLQIAIKFNAKIS